MVFRTCCLSDKLWWRTSASPASVHEFLREASPARVTLSLLPASLCRYPDALVAFLCFDFLTGCCPDVLFDDISMLRRTDTDENPRVVCGSVLTLKGGGNNEGDSHGKNDLIVLGRRTIEPRRGFWGIPAGACAVRRSSRRTGRYFEVQRCVLITV